MMMTMIMMLMITMIRIMDHESVEALRFIYTITISIFTHPEL